MLPHYHDLHEGTSFEVLPAIDLLGGRVVRLVQGDFARDTVFADSPVPVARDFIAGGARWLHVVDLDAARTGRVQHADLISEIVAEAGSAASVEVAGGIRSRASAASALDLGAARVVVGSRALDEPAFVRELVLEHGPERIAVALDVRDAQAVGHGWNAGSRGVPIAEALSQLRTTGVEWLEVTAIARDGMLDGPDVDLLASVVGAGWARVIAAGGIASLADLRAVRALGCAGAIVGRAFYDGTLDNAAAQAALRGNPREG